MCHKNCAKLQKIRNTTKLPTKKITSRQPIIPVFESSELQRRGSSRSLMPFLISLIPLIPLIALIPLIPLIALIPLMDRQKKKVRGCLQLRTS